jgi:hypothetical protein
MTLGFVLSEIEEGFIKRMSGDSHILKRATLALRKRGRDKDRGYCNSSSKA